MQLVKLHELNLNNFMYTEYGHLKPAKHSL